LTAEHPICPRCQVTAVRARADLAVGTECRQDPCGRCQHLGATSDSAEPPSLVMSCDMRPQFPDGSDLPLRPRRGFAGSGISVVRRTTCGCISGRCRAAGANLQPLRSPYRQLCRCQAIVRVLSRISSTKGDNAHGTLDSALQRHGDGGGVRYRRCSQRQRPGQPWVCQRLVSHLWHVQYAYACRVRP